VRWEGLSFLHGIRGSVRVNGVPSGPGNTGERGFTYVIEPKYFGQQSTAQHSTAPHRTVAAFLRALKKERYSPLLAIGPRHEMAPIQ
jgi:hypothetical protein